jgi:hypothetical protein
MALNMVGRCYDLGWGTPVDKVRAAECFRIAAERGLDWGMYNYATALTLGAGVAEDKPAALGWFEKAAAMGNAKAVNFVGSFHEDGWVVPRDMTQGGRMLRAGGRGRRFPRHVQPCPDARRTPAMRTPRCCGSRDAARRRPGVSRQGAAWLAQVPL